MPHDHDSLPVELETHLPNHAPRLLRGRISLSDYHDLLHGQAPIVVRLENCQGCGGASGDLFIRGAHIHSVVRTDAALR